MHDFKYVTRKERAPVKNDLIAIIKRTQNLLRDDFTFRFDFVGSDRRNMVTYVPQTNIGYDLMLIWRSTTMIAIILRKNQIQNYTGVE